MSGCAVDIVRAPCARSVGSEAECGLESETRRRGNREWGAAEEWRYLGGGNNRTFLRREMRSCVGSFSWLRQFPRDLVFLERYRFGSIRVVVTTERLYEVGNEKSRRTFIMAAPNFPLFWGFLRGVGQEKGPK